MISDSECNTRISMVMIDCNTISKMFMISDLVIVSAMLEVECPWPVTYSSYWFDECWLLLLLVLHEKYLRSVFCHDCGSCCHRLSHIYTLLMVFVKTGVLFSWLLLWFCYSFSFTQVMSILKQLYCSSFLFVFSFFLPPISASVNHFVQLLQVWIMGEMTIAMMTAT